MRVFEWWLKVDVKVVLWEEEGMLEFMEVRMVWYQFSNSLSISSRVGYSGKSAESSCVMMSSLKESQFALLKSGRFVMGNCKGFVARVIMIGKWSLVVRGP